MSVDNMAQDKLEQAKTALWNALVTNNKANLGTETELEGDDICMPWQLEEELTEANQQLVKDQVAALLSKPTPKKPVTIMVSSEDLKKIKKEAEDSCLTAACRDSIKAATFNPRKPKK